MSTRLLLIRHAEPEIDAQRRCYGSLDVPLSSRGERQARALTWRLAAEPLSAVYSSPRRRSLDTARVIAERHGREPCVEDDLREIEFGAFDGREYDEIARSYPEIYATWMTRPTEVAFPDGESFTDLRERSIAAMERLLERHRDGTIAVVSHGGPIRAMLAHELGLADEAIFRIGQRYGAVSELRHDGSGSILWAVNS